MEDPGDELVPVPAEVYQLTLYYLRGPFGDSEWAPRVWILGYSLQVLAVGYFGGETIAGMDPNLKAGGIIIGIGASWPAFVFSSCLYFTLWPYLRPMPSHGRQFLVELLKHKVTPDAAELLKTSSVAALGSAKGGSIAFAWLLVGGFAFFVSAQRSFETHEYIIVAVGVLGAPAGAAGQLCLFIVQCGCTIVRDTVGQVTKQVNMARRSGHADFDQIMDAVDEVDALVSTFSSHIQVPLICMLLLGSVCGSAVLMCALGPQPESADHLWNVLHVSKFLLAIAAVLIMGGISCLALPAAITSQVQALERAVNSLRITRQGECAAMAAREDRDKIATILDYMRQKVTPF